MRLLPFLILPLLAGCTELGVRQPFARSTAEPRTPQVAPEVAAVVAAPRPPAAARTAEQFDTTTPEQRAAAVADAEGGTLLGTTVASLGIPTEAGLWIETPLAETPGSGRLVYAETGRSALVELRPIDGPDSAGSRVSLAAMRLLEAPLTGLPTLEVYAQ